MNVTKEEAQQVLDAITGPIYGAPVFGESVKAAITLLQSRLADKEDAEPVAYLWQHCETGRTRIIMPGDVITADATWFVVGPLFTHPAKQVPMTDAEILDFGHRMATKYTHRSDPISPAYGFVNHTLIDFVRAIEQHHGVGS